MAHLTRSPKSANDWTRNDLRAYNIVVSSQSPDEFYGQPLPTVAALSNLDPYLLSATLDTQGLSIETYRLLQYIDHASRANTGQESTINDFMKEILRLLGYEEKRNLLLRSHHAIPLLISGDPDQLAQTGTCLSQGSSTILLVVQEETTFSFHDPEPKVIAAAIATFQYNNCTRAQLGQPELNLMTIPCIVITGTRPTFYLVPVTQELSTAVATSQYPISPTIVKQCVVVSNSHRRSEGMEIPEFRRLSLRHYIAFRTLAEAHWSAFMIPEEMGA
ncbi:hypothetical protein JOM56_002530 [Amanita muscaria]